MLHLIERGYRICNPYELKQLHWEEILESKTISARRRCYNYLFGKQKRKEAEKVFIGKITFRLEAILFSNRINQIIKVAKKEKAEFQASKKEVKEKENGHIIYGMWNTSLLMKITKATINKWRYHRYKFKYIRDASSIFLK